MGAVNRPGVSEFPENQPVTVLSAMMLAGGAGGGADLKNAAIVRPNVVTGQPEIRKVNMDELLKQKDTKKPALDVAMQPGDVLYIPQKDSRRGVTLGDVLNYVPILGWFIR
jgi:protein involved in polysaccharide export with SLBB domain